MYPTSILISASLNLRANFHNVRDDNFILNFFTEKSMSKDSIVTDIGNYSIGLYYSYKHCYGLSLDYFKKVKNKKLKYFNNSIGFVYKEFKKYDSAEIHFRNEILYNGYIQGACTNLSILLLNQGRYNDLKILLNDNKINKFFNPGISQVVAFYYFDFGKYFKSILIEPIHYASNYLALISSLLILISWLIYLKRIEIFDNEKLSNILLVLCLGSLSVLFVDLLSDFICVYCKFRLNGNVLNDFMYSVFAIGLIEESVKILPLLLFLKYTRFVKEPVDYIIYASVSALGFAFIENMKYFDSYWSRYYFWKGFKFCC